MTALLCGRHQLEEMRLKNEKLEAVRKKKTERNKGTAPTTHLSYRSTKSWDRKVRQCQHCPWALYVTEMALGAVLSHWCTHRAEIPGLTPCLKFRVNSLCWHHLQAPVLCLSPWLSLGSLSPLGL